MNAANRLELESYRQIIAQSRDPVAVVDRNYAYLLVNDAFCRLHRKRAEEILGKTVETIVGSKNFHTRLKKFLDRGLAGKNLFFQAWFDLPGAGRRFMEVNYSPVSDNHGTTTGVAVLFHDMTRDITEMKRMEEQLKQRAQELSEVNRALETLLDQSTRTIADQENRIYDNLQELVFPYLYKLEEKLEGREELLHLNVIKANLEKITSTFVLAVSSRLSELTPRELQVAQLIKQGKTTKDIALLLHISPRTVEFYRDKLRKKLGLKSKRINLRSHLSSLA